MTYSSPREIAFLAGAGFSKWSCDLPLVSGLFDFDMQVDSAAEEKRLVRVRTLYDNWRRDHPNQNNEVFITATQTKPGQFNLVNWYITRRLTEPFITNSGRRHTWYVNSSRARTHPGIKRASDLLSEIQRFGRLGLLTTNYDMVFEYALGSKGFNYGVYGEQIGWQPHPYIKPLHVTGAVPLAKLHGSLSWGIEGKRPDPRFGLDGKCIIVPPMARKRPSKIFPDQWRVAKAILNQSRVLVVMGFAFNEYDREARSFLSKQSKRIRRVIVADVSDIRPRIQSLFAIQELIHINPLDPHFIEELGDAVR
jgi:hypothetical protein